MKPKITESAKEIICHELKLPGVHSVILIGSRARGDASAESDYDIYVVAPVSLLPLLLPVLKRREKTLREKLKADVSVSPLTYSRMKRGRDTLVFHTKKEGVVLCGQDVRSKISINSPSELPESELYQYLFDAMYYAIDPVGSIEYNNIKILRSISKAVLYCADLRLLRQGIYIKDKKEIIRKFKDTPVKEVYCISKKNQKIQEKLKSPVINHLWAEARDYLLETAKMMGIDALNCKIPGVQSYPSKLDAMITFVIRFNNKCKEQEIVNNILKEKNPKMCMGLIATCLVASVDSVIPLKVESRKLKKLKTYLGNEYSMLDPVETWISLKIASSNLWKILGLKFPI